MFWHKIIPEINLYLQYFQGEFKLDSAINAMAAVINEPQYNSGYNSIIDFRDTSFVFTEAEIQQFVSFIVKANAAEKRRKVSLLTSNPNQVFYLSLFTHFAQNIKVNYNIFSTVDAAIEWIETDKINFQFIKDEIRLIRST
ncbi:MAG: hypothetical protein JXA77_17415 [Bacteroidales bacterium]|nr:hypothetical protein [Bacteroidales bacterium]MBN2817360.1 hypothetical protein [Bacteroidales bacterium]